MKNFVITIARGYGSGGRTIGRMISNKLGISYYDSEILRVASNESGINEALFSAVDETLKKPRFFKNKQTVTGQVIPPDSEDFVSEQNLFNYQAKVILDLAEKESCVIVGRCADYILRDKPNVIKLYVHGPMEYCIDKTMEVRGMDDREEAEKFIRKTDKRRADYYHYFTGRDWKDADNYDLCLDSSVLGWDKCVALVEAYLKIKMEM